MSDNLENGPSAEEQQAQAEHEAAKKGAKLAAKAIGAYAGGEAGVQAVDALAKTKAGDAILNKGAEKLEKIPGMAKALEKADETGALDAADKATSSMGKGGGAAAGAGAGAGAGANAGASAAGTGDKIAGMSGGSSKIPDFLGDKDDKDDKKDQSVDGEVTGSVGMTILKIGLILALASFPLTLGFMTTSLVVLKVVSYNDALGMGSTIGDDTGDIEYETENKEEQDFYNRVNDVKSEYQLQGKTVDAMLIAAVFHVITRHDEGFTYSDMKKSDIRKIADAMFDDNGVYDEELFKKNLKNKIFPKYFPSYSEDECEALVDEVFDYINDYYDFIGVEKPTNACVGGGSCKYNIPGFYISGRGNVTKNLTISNLQVRLMQCGGRYGSGTWGQPLDEDLVPFEKYVLGVAYQEIGDGRAAEATKAQMVAARSFALARPTAMNNANGKKLEKESNGQWILQMCPCVADQVYCDPDRGCSSMNDGEQHGTMRSGTTGYAQKRKDPMAQNHEMRTWASQVQGEVLVNSQGYVISTSYTSTETNKFIQLANQGYNYKQILLSVYNSSSKSFGATDIKKMDCGGANCAAGTAGSGSYVSWKQTDSKWGNIPLGNSSNTIRSAGCLVTSIAMLIAKSGVPTNVNGEFNPGTFVQALNQHGGFDGYGNLQWTAISAVAPRFRYMDKIDVSEYTRTQKASKLTELVNNGYYVVAEVMGNTGQHWVAIDYINGDVIGMLDPGSSKTNLWVGYKWYNTSKFVYFKAE